MNVHVRMHVCVCMNVVNFIDRRSCSEQSPGSLKACRPAVCAAVGGGAAAAVIVVVVVGAAAAANDDDDHCGKKTFFHN